MPVTIVWGTRDRLLPPRQSAGARALLPQAQHSTLQNAGHVAMLDAPDEIAAIIAAAVTAA